MKINIVLNKNFVTQYNKLQAEYGTDIAALNGFGDEQLSYTDFINPILKANILAIICNITKGQDTFLLS